MDPTSAKFCCGAECGIAVAGTASVGTEHWSLASGSVSVVTSGPTSMLSTRAFRFNPSAATAALRHGFATVYTNPATFVARCYIYFTTLPSASCALLTVRGATSASNCGAYYKSSDTTIVGGRSAASIGSGGITVTTGVWYRVDVSVPTSANHSTSVSVDGVAASVFNGSDAAENFNDFALGNILDSVTGDYYIDSVVVATATAFPIGPGKTVGLYPNADRTNSAATPTDGNKGHLWSATTDFGKGASGATATGNQNAEATSWQSLQNPLSTTIPGSFVSDRLGASTEHMVWELDNPPGDASVVNAVMLVFTTHSASTTANNMVVGHGNATTLSAVVNADLSEATITVPVGIILTDPDVNAWTVARVTAATIFFGNSSDVNPDPFLDGACLEVDVTLNPERVIRRDPYAQLIAH